jgi:cytochrome c biogenesis protein
MSTSVPALPRMTLRQSVALVWRTLRSMRTALILLLLLAMASVVGSLIPQLPNSPERVATYQVEHPLVGGFYRRAGLFDVFGSWWFALIATLLFVSLVACLLPRTRAHLRALRQRPLQARELDGFPQFAERRVVVSPDRTVEVAQRILRRRLFRVSRALGTVGTVGTVAPSDTPGTPTASLAAEKGLARELGSLVFHWAFLLILIGVVYGKGTGFTGRAAIVEGQTWTDAQANYDGEIRTGRFFSGDYTGTQVRLVDFEDTFRRTGQPMDFVSRIELLDADGASLGETDVRVNHPAEVDGLRIFQYGYGWAPVITIGDGQRTLFDGPVIFTQDTAPEEVGQLAMPWHGVLKLPSLDPQVGLEVVLWPDLYAFLRFRQTGEPVAMTEAHDPFITVQAFRGPLTDPSLSGLETAPMREWNRVLVGRGQTKTLGEDGAGGELSVSFPELRQYTVVQVSRDRGVWIVLGAAILVLLGLLPALYTSRRKIWVRAEPDGAGALVRIGGLALQRKAQFEEEFARVVDELARACAEPASEPERLGAR